ncbi:MAG TPA: hypothetical protein PLN80_03355, partial [Anaerolineaceae bacterium]|nr:hypothetical protein [Anaerolineaceae bacterium]
MKSIITRLIAVVLVLALVAGPVAAQGTSPTGPRQVNSADRATMQGVPEGKTSRVSGELKEETAVTELQLNEKGQARYVVILPDEPLATYKGSIAGFAPTAPSILGSAKLDVKSPASQAYLALLKEKQAGFLTAANAVLGFAPEVLFSYRYATNGFAMLLTPEQAGSLASQTGVKVLLAPV